MGFVRRVLHEIAIGRDVCALEKRSVGSLGGQRLDKLLPSSPAVLPEPVSPELVLIDPELARRERARLEEKAQLEKLLDVAALRLALERHPPPVEETVVRTPRWRNAAAFSRRRLVPAALMCSLLANGLFAAHFVARKGDEATQVAIRMVTLTESVATVSTVPTTPTVSVPTTAGPDAVAAPKVSASRLTTKAAVERRVVSLMLTAPPRKLPRNFIDPITGLVKNNVQVVCRSKPRRSFLCAVRLSSGTANKPLYVRYRVTKKGHGVFKWLRPKRS